MNPILFAVIVLGVLGLAGGAILVLASRFMAVYEDPRISQVSECLAGANCGGCGYAGCSDYAEAIVKRGAPTYLCAPGGNKAARAIDQIMGQDSGGCMPVNACVACGGGEACGKKFDYQGIQTCAAAAAVAGGPSACAFGCLGLGDCTRACKFDAIHVVNGAAQVDPEKCTGCGACASACPRSVIRIRTAEAGPAVICSNTDRGAAVTKVCSAGCIGCGICAKNCPAGAVSIENNLAVIDYEKCTGCGTCAEKCPKKVIRPALHSS